MPMCLFNQRNPIATPTAPTAYSSDADLGPVTLLWILPSALIDSFDTAGFTLQKIGPEGEREIIPTTVASLGGNQYLVSGEVGTYPEQSAQVIGYARSSLGYKGGTSYTFATRRGEAAVSSLAEISNFLKAYEALALAQIERYGGAAAPLGLGQIERYAGSGALAGVAQIEGAGGFGSLSAEAQVTVFGGNGALRSVAEVALLAPPRGSAQVGEITVPQFMSSYTAAAQVGVNGLGGLTIEAALNPMTLGAGAADCARARLTVKKDFIDLLAARSAAIGIPQEVAMLAAEIIAGVFTSPGYRALRAASAFTGLPAFALAVRITREAITGALLAAGLGAGVAYGVLRALELGAGGGPLIEVDLIDAILQDAREDLPPYVGDDGDEDLTMRDLNANVLTALPAVTGEVMEAYSIGLGVEDLAFGRAVKITLIGYWQNSTLSAQAFEYSVGIDGAAGAFISAGMPPSTLAGFEHEITIFKARDSFIDEDTGAVISFDEICISHSLHSRESSGNLFLINQFLNDGFDFTVAHSFQINYKASNPEAGTLGFIKLLAYTQILRVS